MKNNDRTLFLVRLSLYRGDRGVIYIGGDDSMTVTQLIETIHTARKSQKLSQSELAEKVGTTQKAISRTEYGSNIPKLDTFIRIAEGLGYEVVLRKK